MIQSQNQQIEKMVGELASVTEENEGMRKELAEFSRTEEERKEKQEDDTLLKNETVFEQLVSVVQ